MLMPGSHSRQQPQQAAAYMTNKRQQRSNEDTGGGVRSLLQKQRLRIVVGASVSIRRLFT
jgi:hypothetical protein